MKIVNMVDSYHTNRNQFIPWDIQTKHRKIKTYQRILRISANREHATIVGWLTYFNIIVINYYFHKPHVSCVAISNRFFFSFIHFQSRFYRLSAVYAYIWSRTKIRTSRRTHTRKWIIMVRRRMVKKQIKNTGEKANTNRIARIPNHYLLTYTHSVVNRSHFKQIKSVIGRRSRVGSNGLRINAQR